MKTIITNLLILLFLSVSVIAKVWTISPSGQYKFCSEISSMISDNDTIEIDNAIYENDRQVSWSKNNLLIKGINGKPRLRAGSIIANDNSNGKGIFVIRGNNTIVENIEFQNAKVPDNNGAGIRQEGSNLTVRHCVFNGNEMGILQGGTITNCKILVEHCEFLSNGSPENPGYQHNIYINHIDTLIFRYNYSHDAIAEGHEFKSRASNNYILYNRISNFNSVDSRNIDLPNGGTAVILGNIIEQGENSANSNIIGFGLEGLINPGPHNLWICSNTIVNKKSKGSFVQVADIDTLFMKNNICVGAKTGGFIIGNPALLDSSNNFIDDDVESPEFVNINGNDYHLTEESPAVNSGLQVSNIIHGNSLFPLFEYKDSADYEPRIINGVIDIGAYEYKTEQTKSEEKKYCGCLLNIFPNPANDKATVECDFCDDFPIIFSLININGILITDIHADRVNNNKFNIYFEGLNSGMYFFITKTPFFQKTIKLEIAR